MANSFNKTTADFAYERYRTLGAVDPDSGIPADDLRPVGTITAQSASEAGESGEAGTAPVESPYTRHDPVGNAPIDFAGLPDDGTDSELDADPRLAEDVGLVGADTESASFGSAVGGGEDRSRSAASAPEAESPEILSGPPAYRDELLESDAALAANASGLTVGSIDYADVDSPAGTDGTAGAAEDDPLPDVPDADAIAADSPVDPAAPPVDAMPGTDLLNGSTGEED